MKIIVHESRGNNSDELCDHEKWVVEWKGWREGVRWEGERESEGQAEVSVHGGGEGGRRGRGKCQYE